MSHSLIRSDLNLQIIRLYSKIGQFQIFWSFSKTSFIQSASTPPRYLVVNDLLGIYLASNGIHLVSHSLMMSALYIENDQTV